MAIASRDLRDLIRRLEQQFTGNADVDLIRLWLPQLRGALQKAFPSDDEIVGEVSRILGVRFRKGMKALPKRHRMHPARIGPESIAEQYRPMLRERIQASAELIKLNRDQEIERQLRRFVGWATGSLPSQAKRSDKGELSKGVTKALQQDTFERRRVCIDQGHKLIAAVDDVVAIEHGAIAKKWRHVIPHAGYQSRPEHLERDGKVYAVKGNAMLEAKRMTKGGRPYADELPEQPSGPPYCFPGDSKVQLADGVRVAYRRWFSGELTSIITESGKTLRATPNHPVLTPNGWVAIGSLKEGDYVIELSNKGIESVALELDGNGCVPTIAEIFEATRKVWNSIKLPGATEQFHGDGSESDVDTVYADRPLSFGVDTLGQKSRKNFRLSHADLARARFCSVNFFRYGTMSAATSIVSSLSIFLVPIARFLRGFQDICFFGTPAPNACQFEAPSYYGTSASITFGESKLRFPAFVKRAQFLGINLISSLAPFKRFAKRNSLRLQTLIQSTFFDSPDGRDFRNSLPKTAKAVKLVNVNRNPWSGHVYNLETRNGWYVTEGIVAHNCSCFWEAIYDLEDLPDDMRA